MGMISWVAAYYPDFHQPGLDFLHMFYGFFCWVSIHISPSVFNKHSHIVVFLRTHLPKNASQTSCIFRRHHWRWHPGKQKIAVSSAGGSWYHASRFLRCTARFAPPLLTRLTRRTFRGEVWQISEGGVPIVPKELYKKKEYIWEV